jgi:hypothetical protein
MPTPTYTPLATVTLGSAAASVTFGSIPATYRDLIIVTDTLNSAGLENMKMRLNSDTSSSYNAVILRGNGLSAGSRTLGGTYAFIDDLAYGDATNRHNHIIQFIDYSATNKHKTILSRANNVGLGNLDAIAIQWINTSAITTIRLFYEVGNITTGSRFDLYGIAS